MNTTTKIILVVILLLGAGGIAYFLLKPKQSSASSSHAESGGTDNELAGYPATTDSTPENGQPSTHSTTHSAFPYHIVGYEVRIMEGSADMTTLPFDKTTPKFPHQNGVIPVSNGMYNVGWGLDMVVAGDGIEWRLDIQGTVKSGKFLFEDMTDGKKASDWGYASVGWGFLAGRVTWQLTMWVE